jgi:hypothetical protein
MQAKAAIEFRPFPTPVINWIRFGGFIAMQNLRLSPPLGNNKEGVVYFNYIILKLLLTQ